VVGERPPLVVSKPLSQLLAVCLSQELLYRLAEREC
jgi:hypothetical protein